MFILCLLRSDLINAETEKHQWSHQRVFMNASISKQYKVFFDVVPFSTRLYHHIQARPRSMKKMLVLLYATNLISNSFISEQIQGGRNQRYKDEKHSPFPTASSNLRKYGQQMTITQ